MKQPCRTLILLSIALLPSLAAAQDIAVGPVPATAKIQWTMDAVDAATAQNVMTYLPFVDGKPAGAAPLPAVSVTCSVLVAIVSCQATPIPQVVLDAVNRIGPHQLTLAAVHPEGGQSSPSIPFALSRPTPAPTGLRLTR